MNLCDLSINCLHLVFSESIKLLVLSIYSSSKNILVEQVGDRKVSPIAYYVFFFYLRKNQTQATPIGNVEESSSNKVSPCNIKMINAWNQMAYMNRYISDYLYDHRDDYSGYFFDEHLLEFMNKMGI